jgi:hypothetical protein
MYTVQSLAKEALECFETAKRQPSGEEFYRIKDGSPDWVQELCQDAHGSMLPDDWRYQFIQESLCVLADTDDVNHDDTRLEADIFNYQLTAWLGSHGDRPGYVDEACDDYGAEADHGIMYRIARGQEYEKNEVLGLVRTFLEERAEELNDGGNES